MSMTDPIADMLTRVRNAHSVGKPTVSMPSSKKLVEIARIMQEEGYIQGFEIIDGDPRVLGGLGTAIISTSQGVMTDRDARNKGIGGEVIAYIW